MRTPTRDRAGSADSVETAVTSPVHNRLTCNGQITVTGTNGSRAQDQGAHSSRFCYTLTVSTQFLAFLGIAAVVICVPGPDTALTIRNALTGHPVSYTHLTLPTTPYV